VLDEQAGRGHVVSVDDEPGVGRVDVPTDRARDPVVRAPGPDVVEDHVVAVDLQADGGLADVWAADPEEDVLQDGRVVVSVRFVAGGVPGADP
jgi:hypothetical protein